ncbi:hypothetical protein RSAG8_01755, partial [Rhizoctonia solani AG-8 WAC10335]
MGKNMGKIDYAPTMRYLESAYRRLSHSNSVAIEPYQFNRNFLSREACSWIYCIYPPWV